MRWVDGFIIVVCMWVLAIPELKAQDDKEDVASVIARIHEQLITDEENVFDWESLEEDLMFFAQNPINLNNTSKESLDRLQFLSDKQVENLLYYLYRQKKMQTIYELQLVEGFDMFTIRNLLPFVYVGEVSDKKDLFPGWKNLWRYGKQEVLLRTDRTLEEKQGYAKAEGADVDAADDKHYLGSPYYLALKYQFRYRDKIEMGVVGEKDAGEQFWGSAQKGFDFYSGYLQLRNIGCVKTLVAGNYRANFGLGLVMHPELSFGKSASVMTVLPRNTGLRKSASTDEYNYLRGLGVTLKSGKAEYSAFYSYRFIDGDSTGTSFSTIKTDGLHRIRSRMLTKNAISMQVVGLNVALRFTNLHLGLTITDTRLGRDFQPEMRPDNLFYFRGNHQIASGVNYRARVRGFTLFGEEAVQTKGGAAFLNGFSVSPVSQVNIVALHRYYSKQYDVLLANAFSEGSKVNNEEGVYVGLEVNPIRKWKITVYSDVYTFPWLRYQINRASVGGDWMLTSFFQPNKQVEMNWRIRHVRKEKNLPQDGTTVYTACYQRSSLRYGLSYTLNNGISGRNIVEFNQSVSDIERAGYGVLLSQEISYAFSKLPLSFDVRYEFFDAKKYENSFYSYERDILYVFSTPMLYGQGSRWYLNCRFSVGRQISFWMKIAQTLYEAQDTIGTGLEQINAPHKTDIRGMVRVRF